MAVDKNKVIAEATKFAQRGQWDRAIKVYDKILNEDPKDVRVLLKVGELHQKRGDDAAAAATFNRVAEAYTDQGFFLKAIAVYKQMMKMAPDDLRVNERLASLYQQLGIMSDAMAQMQLVAAAAEKAGDQAKLLDVLQRMTEIEPDNVGSAVKLGEIHARGGRTTEALEQFRRAADLLKRNNRAEEYVRVAERIVFLAPDDVTLTRELANIYLAKGDTKRALAKLQLCFKADPKDLDTLNLLAQAFRDLGQTTKTISVFKELAHVYVEKGRPEDARATWRRVQELAPDDADAAAALAGRIAGPSLSPAPASRPAEPRPTPPRTVIAPPPAPPPGPPPGAVRPPLAPAPVVPPPAPPVAAAPPPPRPAGPDAIPKLLTETDVYVKYGLHQKALDHLRKVFDIDAEHLEAREKARDIRLSSGDAAGAAEEAVRVVHLYLARGLSESALAAWEKLREIAPAHPELAALGARAGGAASLEGPDVVAPLPGAADELMVESAAEEADDVALAAAGAVEEEVVDDDDEALLAAEEGEDGPVEDDEPLFPAAAAAAPPPVSRPTPPPAARARLTPPPAPPPRLTPPPAPASRFTPPPRLTPAYGSPPPPREDEELDLSDELEEAEFFMQQGLYDDARDALQNLAGFYPDHSAVRAKLGELERRRAAAVRPGTLTPPPSRPAAPAAVPDGGFDIGRELAAELGSEAAPAGEEFQYSVEEVFSQFKKGVAQTVKAEDTATHYDLGIAYKEMGLVEDALEEFKTALQGASHQRQVDCLSMIGLCQMVKGDPTEAARAFRRALKVDGLRPESVRALQYELGVAYQTLGDAEGALWYLQKVVGGDRAFRDAAARVQKLGGGPGRPPGDAEGLPLPGAAAGGPKKNIGYV